MMDRMNALRHQKKLSARPSFKKIYSDVVVINFERVCLSLFGYSNLLRKEGNIEEFAQKSYRRCFLS